MSDAYLPREVAKFMIQLSEFSDIIRNDHEVLGPIVEAEVTRAANTSLDAGFGGRYDDGGASMIVERLKAFLQGVQYGASRDTDNLGGYGKIYEKVRRENDPKYQEYLRLKEIYGE